MSAPIWHRCRLVSSTCMSYKSQRETNLSSVLNLGGSANFKHVLSVLHISLKA